MRSRRAVRRAGRAGRAGTVLAAVLALSLAACGNGKSILDAGYPDATVPATLAAGETTLPPTTTTTPLDKLPKCPVDALASASGPVDITFWHAMNGALEKSLVKLTKEYNASQSKVHVTLQNQGGYEQNITKYLASSQSGKPDLVQMPEYTVQQMRDTDSNVPVEACIQADGYDMSTFLPRAAKAYSTEGVQWSMPFNVSDPVLYYLKKIFKAAGLDPAKPPLTLEEVRADSQKIVDSKAAAFGIALDTGADSGGGWYLEQWFAKAGEFYADNENGRAAPATRVLYDGPTGVELITYLQGLVNDGLAVNVGDNASGQDNFLKLADPARPAAMTIGTSAALGSLLSIVRGGTIPGITEADIGVGPMPGPAGAPGALVGGASLWIVDGKGDARTAAAWDYIKFLVDAQTQSTWAADSGYVPVRSDALDLDPIKSLYVTDPRFKVAYTQLQEAADKPSSLGPVLGPLREVRQVTARAMAAALNGTPAQKALTAGATQSNKLIANYNARHG